MDDHLPYLGGSRNPAKIDMEVSEPMQGSSDSAETSRLGHAHPRMTCLRQKICYGSTYKDGACGFCPRGFRTGQTPMTGNGRYG